MPAAFSSFFQNDVITYFKISCHLYLLALSYSPVYYTKQEHALCYPCGNVFISSIKDC